MTNLVKFKNTGLSVFQSIKQFYYFCSTTKKKQSGKNHATKQKQNTFSIKTTANPRTASRKQQHIQDESYQRTVECFQREESKRYGSYVQPQESDMWREISPVNLQKIDGLSYNQITYVFVMQKRLVVVEWVTIKFCGTLGHQQFGIFCHNQYFGSFCDKWKCHCPFHMHALGGPMCYFWDGHEVVDNSQPLLLYNIQLDVDLFLPQ